MAWPTRSWRARIRAGSVNTLAGWVRNGTPQAVALGGDPAVDDVGQPGRHPPRHQRRHPGVPLVRARSPAPDGVEQSDRRDAIRPGSRTAKACSRTIGASICNLHDRRRHAVLPDDRLDQGRGRRDRREQAFLASSSAQPATCARSRCSSASSSRSSSRRAEPVVRRSSRRCTEAAKYAGMRAASNVVLRDINVALIIDEMYRGANVIYVDFTDYDEIAHHCRARACRGAPGARRHRRGDRDARQGDRGGSAAVQVRRPVRPRPEPRRDVQAALRQEPRRVRPRADGRSGDGRPVDVEGRGLDVRQCIPLGDYEGQGVGPTVARAALRAGPRRRRRPRRGR